MFQMWGKLVENNHILQDLTEFKRRSKTRFTQDNFIESLEFDYLEIQITEE